MIKEFQAFLKRGNVIDLAVAVIIGAAFSGIVNSLVNDIIMPLIGIIIGGINFGDLVLQVGSAQVLYGNFIQAVINFVVIAFVVFLVVRSYNRLRAEKPAAPAAPPPTPQDVVLLTEIRDILNRQTELN